MTGDAAALSADAGPPLTVLTGPAGIGRSHLVRTLRQSMAGARRPVLEVRLAPPDRAEPWYLAGRVLAGLAPVPSRLVAGRDHGGPAELSAARFARVLRHRPGLVVLVDDVQWADVPSAEVLLAAVHELAGSQTRFIVALRTPADPAPVLADGFARLRTAGLAQILPVRPLTAGDAGALIHEQLQAVPHESLSAPLRRLSRGLPGALLAAIEGYRRTAALHIVDRRAYLLDPSTAPRIPADHDLTARVRHLEPATRAVARALAVLEPLGPTVPALIGDAVGVPSEEVHARLGTLRREGVARRDPGGWRVPVPAMAVALRAGLGPYERARVAQVAVEALWTGRARSADPGFLPDQVAAAGGLVKATVAVPLLRSRAAAAAVRSPAAAARWWGAAELLSGDPADRAEALISRIDAGLRAGRYGAVRADVRRVLGEHTAGLSVAARQEAELMALAGVRGERDMDAVRSVAAGEPWAPGGPSPTPVTRAAALTVLNRWAEAAGLLGRLRSHSHPPDGGAADTLGLLVAAVTGRTAPSFHDRPPAGADAGARSARRSAAAAIARCGVTLIADDRLEPGSATAVSELPAPERCLLDWRSGRWDAALDGALFAMAADLAVGRPPLQALVHRAAAEITAARGRPARARTVLDTARADEAPLRHVIDGAVAEIEWILGDAAGAARTAENALADAARHGLLLGTDELWLTVVELAMERGDDEAARTAAASATAAAAVLGTEASELRAAVARLISARDAAAAGEVVALARRAGRPYELARTLERVVRWTGRSPELLAEAYDLLGRLGALLHRSRLRPLMREHALGLRRSQTLAEGEQLLAVLVAEGLSNRELAAATQSSEKSVEGRLTRLFTRTGYRSRVELAAAVLVGDYGPG
ncbi:AAA family ATPase [Actinoplanes sp. NPDC089786]|uniref:AAA family ATPase n=1 Tax=Actinoplanes sp. NPDC089786 TaxID=3155185 RepID=UPI00343F3642